MSERIFFKAAVDTTFWKHQIVSKTGGHSEAEGPAPTGKAEYRAGAICHILRGDSLPGACSTAALSSMESTDEWIHASKLAYMEA